MEALRQAGHDVRVLTWGRGAGDFHLGSPTPSPVRLLCWLPTLRRAQQVVIHYAPGFFDAAASRPHRLLWRLTLALLWAAARDVEVVVHEHVHFPPPARRSLPMRVLWHLERLQWLAARRIVFHNAHSRELFCAQFPAVTGRCEVVEHGRDFSASASADQIQARRVLSLPEEGTLVVSPGFISFYKGYEDAIRVVSRLPVDSSLSYFVVGSVNEATAGRDAAYLASLRELAQGESRIRIREEYLTDESFDYWILASDAVLLPYRSSTSSSVLARCRLLGRPAIVASRARGLCAERSEQDCCYDSDEQLLAILRNLQR